MEKITLITLIELGGGTVVRLPPDIETIYGTLAFPERQRPYVITNFVSTLDGVISLVTPGHSGGGDISGFLAADQAVMGLLRAAADAVIVGAGQLRRPPGTLWTPEHIYPPLAAAYRQMRKQLGKSTNPLQVVVTSGGQVDLSLPVFHDDNAPACIFTTDSGRETLTAQAIPDQTRIIPMPSRDGRIPASAILANLSARFPLGLFLIEGGPSLVDAFLLERRLDELFLTLAPQVAGRAAETERPGFAFGHYFAPLDPRWSKLVSLKQCQDHLFLRYRFETAY